MELSARNQLRGTVKSLTLGNVMAEAVVNVGGQEIASAITRSSAERLGVAEGDTAVAIVKAAEVLIGKEERPRGECSWVRRWPPARRRQDASVYGCGGARRIAGGKGPRGDSARAARGTRVARAE